MSTAQQAFILCGSDRTMLQALLDELKHQLAEQAATILLYGVTNQRREGFIVVEAARGIPTTVQHWLAARPDILECVVYDVPSWETEREAPSELSLALHLALLILERHYQIIPDEAGGLRLVPRDENAEKPETIGPPRLPKGYTAIGQPVPLLSPRDSRWIVRARGEEGEGILIYEDQRCVVFLIADEALSALSSLMQEALTLAQHGSPEFVERHAQTLSQLRSLWWAEETDRVRAWLTALSEGQP